MTQQNVKGAAKTAGNLHKTNKRYFEEYEILVAKGAKEQDESDYEIYVFASIKDLKEFRNLFPEIMKNAYCYMLSTGFRVKSHVCIAKHFKQFLKLTRTTEFYI